MKNEKNINEKNLNTTTQATNRSNMNNKTDDYKPETARLPGTQKIKLHSDDEQYVEKALHRLGDTLKKLRDDRCWKNSTMLEHLDVNYFSRTEQLSRVIENETAKRLPNAGQLFDLRRVFGISLDAIADGEDPFEFERMSNAHLVELLEHISFELGKRIRQE